MTNPTDEELDALTRTLCIYGIMDRSGDTPEIEDMRSAMLAGSNAITALRAQLASSQPADPDTNAGCCQAPSPPEHYDDYCIRQFAKLMSEKMAASRAKGRSGWHNPEECSVEYLRSLLYEHLDKGDPVDVANFCMMLRHYNASTYREFCNCTPKPVPMTLAERDDLRAKQAQMEEVVSSYRTALLEFGIDGSKGSGK